MAAGTDDNSTSFDTLNWNLTLLDISANNNNTARHQIQWTVSVCFRVTMFSIIFLCTVVGNALVILTLAQNKRMRTVTNVFLLNLALSDLLLGVFCMPFTLVGGLLRDFVFGQAMCKMIPFAQAVSVSVSVWTLVSISLERFFAICRPLQSRRWQTVSHAYRIILLIWLGSLFTMAPVALLSRLTATKTPGKHKCREEWPDEPSEQTFNIYLMVVLFLVPLMIMTLMYALIVRTLWIGMRLENLSNHNTETDSYSPETQKSNSVSPLTKGDLHPRKTPVPLRGHYQKSQKAKMRVIRMLFVLVIEFFICWTPLYVVNTAILYDMGIYSTLGAGGVAAVQLLSYVSACSNPITYCFLHSKFRQGFLTIMGCKGLKKPGRESFFSNTMQSVYSTRVVSIDTSEKVEDDQL